MKRQSTLSIAVGFILALTISGCTKTLSHGITPEGTVQTSYLIFPKLDDAWQKAGQFPNSENLAKIKPGVSKDELYQLIGRPHFSEAQHAYEWDYIFKFYQPDESIKICQYKVIFDKDFKGQQFYWLPEDCATYANQKSPLAVTVVAPITAPVINEKITLSADALFAFDKFKSEDILTKGRAELDELAQKLVGYQQQGRTQVVITGHTDYLGEDRYNMNLSMLRAQTVRSYLINRGVAASSIMATGAGESQPVKQCDSTLARQDLINCLQPNRRVEASVSVYQ